MHKLIQNEWIKIFKQQSTFIMIGVLIVIIIAFAGIAKYIDSQAESVNQNWKEELVTENENWNSTLEETAMITPSLREVATRSLAINEYRIEHNIPPAQEYNMWSFISESTGLISFAGLFVIIIAAGMVANEFSWGTIKVLLVKPFHRWKILLAKYATVNLFLIFMLALLFIISMVLGLILFGPGQDGSNIHLAYVNGSVEEQSQLFYLIKSYLLNSLSVFLLAAMAFMISAVFRSSALSIGISIFLLMTGGTVTNLLASRFDWAKYSLFANTNLMQYADGMPMVEGMTLSFSVTMMVAYFLLFMALAFVFFTKRDVAT